MLEKLQRDLKEAFDHLQVLWGIIFRALFIFSIGFFAYNWIDSHDIGDIPLAQLTLKSIFSRLLAIAVVIVCGGWFFCFPNHEKGKPNPYIFWAQCSYYLVALAIVGYCLIFLKR